MRSAACGGNPHECLVWMTMLAMDAFGYLGQRRSASGNSYLSTGTTAAWAKRVFVCHCAYDNPVFNRDTDRFWETWAFRTSTYSRRSTKTRSGSLSCCFCYLRLGGQQGLQDLMPFLHVCDGVMKSGLAGVITLIEHSLRLDPERVQWPVSSV